MSAWLEGTKKLVDVAIIYDSSILKNKKELVYKIVNAVNSPLNDLAKYQNAGSHLRAWAKMLWRGNNMKKIFLIPLLLLGFVSRSAFAQNLTRNELKVFGDNLDRITGTYNVQTMAITRTAAVYIYGGGSVCSNGSDSLKIPNSLSNKINEFRVKKMNIMDIHMTESGEWCVVGDIISVSENFPVVGGDAIDNLINNDRDVVMCVSFNDYGDWCVLGNNVFYASSQIQKHMENARDRFGHIKYVNITNDAVIVSCENGQYCSVGWSVPLVKNLIHALNEKIDFRPKVIKLFPTGGYFIGNDDINMWTAEF